MENQILDLQSVEERAVTLPYDMLSQSIRHEGKYGNALETKPVQIWNLISDVSELLEKVNINHQREDIYIQKRSSAALLNDADKNAGFNKYYAPINRWRFDKVITSLRMPNIERPGANARIALTLNDFGLSVAFGMHISVCTNFSVLGGTLLRTYSFNREPGLSWDTMKMKMKSWTQSLEQLFTIQAGIMNNMM